MARRLLLGVNIDHVATLRQVRGTSYPDPVTAALIAEQAGADGITLHLREDRRHIQERDVRLLSELLQTRMNLEMALTEEMRDIALRYRPAHVCLVPEKRAELTTEGGLDVCAQQARVREFCQAFAAAGITVSLFIDPDPTQIDAAIACGAPVIELHTGTYAELAEQTTERRETLRILERAIAHAREGGLIVNAGHGLHAGNVFDIACLPGLHELNIGHALIARAIFSGLPAAITEMLAILDRAAAICPRID